MVRKKNVDSVPRMLTEVELELMNLIWATGEATVKDVVEKLPSHRRLAYTTVATVLKVLEQKKFLFCEKGSHAHVFVPLVKKEDYEKTCVRHLVSHVFDGEPIALVQRLLHTSRLRLEDIQTIETELKNLLRREDKIK